ncbi:DUF2975 domain-containing protein [Marinomonas rhizomae]|uniref:DUF2975 family protein n=1 Tax=Marinomonas rhizomae TaxID=491948 RepID=A0A366J2Z1_9GAMM|nr:DUF2975 domain-containing protein [Marinomonas rhizomae]RBP81237.1 DUF2975 family protein [Marinomonas rhizomae]RNF72389.1 DUF2975 domain-containing protein [Marinomonas rhizomae]
MQQSSKIKYLSSFIHFILSISIAIVPVYYVSYWFFINQYPIMSANSSPIEAHALPLEMQAIGFISSLLPLSTLILILLNVRKLFSYYKEGIVFSMTHVSLFKTTSRLLLLWVFLSIAYESGKSVIFSWSNPIGERGLSIGFGSEQLIVIIVATFIYVISWIVDEGRKLAEENQMTV